MQDPATQLPRIPLLRRWVNKRSVSYYLHPLDRVPGVEEQPPAGSLIVVEHDAPVAHALQVAADLLRLAVLFPRHELQLHGLVYPVVEFHQASSTLDSFLSYRTPYVTMGAPRGTITPPNDQEEEAKDRGFLEEALARPGG